MIAVLRPEEVEFVAELDECLAVGVGNLAGLLDPLTYVLNSRVRIGHGRLWNVQAQNLAL